jgi:maleate cis-trans isomerase
MSPCKRIGVMIPSTNTTCEADFQLTVPRDVTVHGQRLWLTNDSTGDEAYVRMNGEIESGARYLATANVDVVVYGCTTGSFYKGPGWDTEMLELIRREAGVPAVATPYPEWNNQRLRAYLEAQGFDQDPEEVAEFAARVCRPEADALLCSCTAWRSVEAIADIEARTGKPAVSSNQSTIWTALRVLGVTRPITGFGRLLEHLAPARPAPAAR